MSQVIEYENGFRIVNNYPDLTEEELEKVDNEILRKLYNLFYNNNNKD